MSENCIVSSFITSGFEWDVTKLCQHFPNFDFVDILAIPLSANPQANMITLFGIPVQWLILCQSGHWLATSKDSNPSTSDMMEGTLELEHPK